jgi:hypothetical protein
MNLFTRICHRLLRNTKGTGEVLGTLLAVGIAVVFGLAAVKAIGEKTKTVGESQSNKVSQLPGGN